MLTLIVLFPPPVAVTMARFLRLDRPKSLKQNKKLKYKLLYKSCSPSLCPSVYGETTKLIWELLAFFYTLSLVLYELQY